MGNRGPWILRRVKPRRIFLTDGRLPLDDLGFLKRHAATVQELWIEGDGVVDVASIQELERLRLLSINADRATRMLQLGSFPHLQFLKITGDIDIDWAGAGPLEQVELVGGDQMDAEALAGLNNLQALRLIAGWVPTRFSGALEELCVESPVAIPAAAIAGLSQLTALSLVDFPCTDLTLFERSGVLESLYVFDAPNLVSLSGIELSDAEGELWLSHCPKLKDLAAVTPPVDAIIDQCPELP